jgi:hypothetical protein
MDNWEGLKEVQEKVSGLLPQAGLLRHQLPGEAQLCAEQAYLKLREAEMWLNDGVAEENIQ